MQYKITHTHHLQVARFFLSHGINNFGFTFDVLNPYHISINDAKEIIQWLYQPNIIIEIANHQTLEEIQFLTDELHTNKVEINFNHPQFNEIIHQFEHVWININNNEFRQIGNKLSAFPIIIKIENENDLKNMIHNNIIINKNELYIICENINWIKSVIASKIDINICITDTSQNEEIPYDLFEEFLEL